MNGFPNAITVIEFRNWVPFRRVAKTFAHFQAYLTPFDGSIIRCLRVVVLAFGTSADGRRLTVR